jgi:hypothetical protein
MTAFAADETISSDCRGSTSENWSGKQEQADHLQPRPVVALDQRLEPEDVADEHRLRPAVLDYQQVGAQQLRLQRRREREPEDAALTG